MSLSRMPTTTPTNPPHGQPFPLTPEDTWALQAHALLWLGNPKDLTIPKGPGVECLNPLLQKDPEQPILIRKEFSDLWDEISFWAKQIPWSERGVAIWGNPGSGKSLFLRYALARALLAGTPILLCEHPSHLLYFSASGVQRVSLAQIENRGYDLRFDLGLPSPPPIALWDTNLEENMPTPHKVFLCPWSLPFFIVQATEVGDAQWRGWVKEWNGRIWLFDAWTEEEIGKLEQIKPTPPEFYTPLEISRLLGPNPRACTTPIPKNPSSSSPSPLTSIQTHFPSLLPPLPPRTLTHSSPPLSQFPAFTPPRNLTTAIRTLKCARTPSWPPLAAYLCMYKDPGYAQAGTGMMGLRGGISSAGAFLRRRLFRALGGCLGVGGLGRGRGRGGGGGGHEEEEEERLDLDQMHALQKFCEDVCRQCKQDVLLGGMAYEVLGAYFLFLPDARPLLVHYPNYPSQTQGGASLIASGLTLGADADDPRISWASEPEPEPEPFPSGMPVHDLPSPPSPRTGYSMYMQTHDQRLSEDVLYIPPADQLLSIDAFSITSIQSLPYQALSPPPSPSLSSSLFQGIESKSDPQGQPMATSTTHMKLTLLQLAFHRARPITEGDVRAVWALVDDNINAASESASASTWGGCAAQSHEDDIDIEWEVDVVYLVPRQDVGRALVARSVSLTADAQASPSPSFKPHPTPKFSMRVGYSIPNFMGLPVGGHEHDPMDRFVWGKTSGSGRSPSNEDEEYVLGLLDRRNRLASWGFKGIFVVVDPQKRLIWSSDFQDAFEFD